MAGKWKALINSEVSAEISLCNLLMMIANGGWPRSPQSVIWRLLCHLRVEMVTNSWRGEGTCLPAGHIRTSQAWSHDDTFNSRARGGSLRGTRPMPFTCQMPGITYSTTKLRMYSKSFCRLHWGRKVLLSSKTDTLFCLVSLKTPISLNIFTAFFTRQ